MVSSHPESAAGPTTAAARKASAAAFVGTTIEWYDFFAYATAAALVLGDLFFPAHSNPLVGVLEALATYAIGFVTRPVGGIVFGHLGDRLGRCGTLVLTLSLMGAATFLMGLLPTYSQIGWVSTLMLVLLRLTQGFAVGGEWGGAAVLSVEHAPIDRRMFFGSFTQLGSPAGALLSTLAFSAVGVMGDATVHAWAWRLPFLASIILVIVGLVVRLRVEESPEFAEIRAEDQRTRAPIRDVLVSSKARVIAGVGALALATGGYYIITTLLLTYGTKTIGLSSSFILTGLSIAAAAEIVCIPISGWAADRWGARRVVAVGVVASIILIAPQFYALHSASRLLVYLLLIFMRCVGQAAAYGPMAGVLADLFPTPIRYTGASLAYQLAGLIFGAFSPLIGAALLTAMHGQPPGLITFFIFECVLVAASMWWITRLRIHAPTAQVARDASPSGD